MQCTSPTTLGFLLRRLSTANRRWDEALRRTGYPEPDDPSEKEFTDDDWALYGWADAWRCAVHWAEGELAQTPEYARNFTDVGFVTSSEPVVFQGELRPEQLETATRDLRSGFDERGGKAKR